MDAAAFARAYLAAIGANTLGEGLRQAADFIQPSIDITPFLGVARRRTLSGSGNLAAGIATLQTVPDGECWVLRQVSFRVTTGGADTATAALCTVGPDGAGAGATWLTDSITLPINTVSVRVAHFPQGLLLDSKSNLSIRGEAVTGVPTQAYGILVDVFGGAR